MAGNTFGKLFTLSSFGESHGVAIGGIIDGMPSGFKIDLNFIRNELTRRSPKGHPWETSRVEEEEVEFLSGLIDQTSTGAPIAFVIKNKNVRSQDYEHLESVFRPSHADYSYFKKYGIKDHRGGGRSSARETAVRVVAGSIAKQYLAKKGIHFNSFTIQIGKNELEDFTQCDLSSIEDSPVRCPDPILSEKMMTDLLQVKDKGDTMGGIIHASIKGVEAGLGAPVFDKLNADLAKAIMSINAVKGFEVGSGFSAARQKGSQHNDAFVLHNNEISTTTNNSGGIQGGISNGEEIHFNVAFKPISSIMMEQKSVNVSKKEVIIPPKGRHDVCVVPRAGVIVESMAALVIMDHYLRNRVFKLD